ncbi:unnamed protein product [Arabis nemorensis]|uniref:Uncharacterized protein n=1 Tax=Arabis nemorensis TaxID=586526 RepID=A0A565BMX6_9BRAS|nr:unnamed protein product [Arabis nemorensis]
MYAFASSADHEVSFVLSLYPNGYSIGKPSEASHLSTVDFSELGCATDIIYEMFQRSCICMIRQEKIYY